MSSYLPEGAIEFSDYFARVEYALRRNGYSRTDQRKSMIDWARFATDLGEPFLGAVRAANMAGELLQEPPRAYHRDQTWQPEHQEPINNVAELFVRGVCQVRHNIVHGEKFMFQDEVRDHALVREAHWVLQQAIAQHPQSAAIRAILDRR
jgi:hypothetical protein